MTVFETSSYFVLSVVEPDSVSHFQNIKDISRSTENGGVASLVGKTATLKYRMISVFDSISFHLCNHRVQIF